MNFWTELSNRYKQESPKFFVKIQSFGKWAMATGLALTGVPAALTGIIPNSGINLETMVMISSYIILAGLVANAVAASAVKSPDYSTLDKKPEEVKTGVE